MTALTLKLPPPPPEPPANKSITCLAPRFADRVAAVIRSMQELGLEPVIAEACRSDERQAWLFGFGRDYDDGRGVVTNAPDGRWSWHRFGLAVDIVDRHRGWDAPSTFWKTLGATAIEHGLAWGGAWPRFPDKPHIQWGPPMRQSPSSRAWELLEAGGLQAVWREVHAA